MQDTQHIPLTQVSLEKAGSLDSPLKDGNFVFVRVLSHLQNGKTLISFAGKQFEVTSFQNFAVGSSFKAQIKIVAHTVLLIPQNAVHENELKIIHGANMTNPQNSALFASLGLPPDQTIFKLLQMLMQNGAKIIPEQVLKAKRLGQKFVQNEDEAAESALFLLEKGIDPDETLVAVLMSFLQNGSGSAYQNGKEFENQKTANGDEENFLGELYENPIELMDLNPGFLTLINHTGKSKNHWIVLPFENCFENQKVTGTIRILCNTEQKTTQKIAISAFTKEKSYYFFVDFINSANSTLLNEKKCVYFSMYPLLEQTEQQKYCKLFLSVLGERFTVHYSETLARHSFFNPDLPMFSVEMDV